MQGTVTAVFSEGIQAGNEGIDCFSFLLPETSSLKYDVPFSHKVHLELVLF